MSLPEFPRLQVADVNGKGVVFNQSYHLNSKLVALKQFPDPSAEFDPSTETGMKACYQAVVETAIEEFEGDRVTDWSVGKKAVIEFPERSRVDIFAAFGLVSTGGNRRVEVTPDKMGYRFGRMLFARPSQTTVWKVV
jgi:hypothetical protein